jgi:threonine synthase
VDQGRIPESTGSLKDRASSIAVAIARASGIDAAACASTGNAASSLSMFAASSGLRSFAFVPVTTSAENVLRWRRLGATVFLADSYERAFELCQQAVAEFGWFDRNAALDPRLVEGKKTCGIEIGLQTADRPPDWVSVSVGDGCTIAGIAKGSKEAVRFGPALATPRLLATQARRVAPLARAFAEGRNEWDVRPSDSVASSIAVADPRNGAKALSAVRESGGVFVDVDDGEIIAAREELRAHGIVADPAAVAGIAGIRRAREEGTIQPLTASCTC